MRERSVPTDPVGGTPVPIDLANPPVAVRERSLPTDPVGGTPVPIDLANPPVAVA